MIFSNRRFTKNPSKSGRIFLVLLSSMVFFQELKQKLEYFLFESCEHRIFYDEHHFSVVVDDGYLIRINHFTDIVVEEIERIGDGYNFTLQSRSLGLCERFRCYDTPLNFLECHKSSVIIRKIGFCFL